MSTPALPKQTVSSVPSSKVQHPPNQWDRAGLLAAILLPLTMIPYAIARAQTNSLRRTVEQLRKEIATSALAGRLGMQKEVGALAHRLDKTCVGLDGVKSVAAHVEMRVGDLENAGRNSEHLDAAVLYKRVWELQEKVDKLEHGDTIQVSDRTLSYDLEERLAGLVRDVDTNVADEIAETVSRVGALETSTQQAMDSLNQRLLGLRSKLDDHDLSALTSVLKADAEAGAARLERLENVVGSVTSAGEAAYNGASSITMQAKEALDRARQELAEVRSDNVALHEQFALLMHERQQSRGQAAIFGDLGESLADLASFIQEMELTWGLTPKDRQINGLRRLAQKLQDPQTLDGGPKFYE